MPNYNLTVQLPTRAVPTSTEASNSTENTIPITDTENLPQSITAIASTTNLPETLTTFEITRHRMKEIAKEVCDPKSTASSIHKTVIHMGHWDTLNDNKQASKPGEGPKAKFLNEYSQHLLEDFNEKPVEKKDIYKRQALILNRMRDSVIPAQRHRVNVESGTITRTDGDNNKLFVKGKTALIIDGKRIGLRCEDPPKHVKPPKSQKETTTTNESLTTMASRLSEFDENIVHEEPLTTMASLQLEAPVESERTEVPGLGLETMMEGVITDETSRKLRAAKQREENPREENPSPHASEENLRVHERSIPQPFHEPFSDENHHLTIENEPVNHQSPVIFRQPSKQNLNHASSSEESLPQQFRPTRQQLVHQSSSSASSQQDVTNQRNDNFVDNRPAQPQRTIIVKQREDTATQLLRQKFYSKSLGNSGTTVSSPNLAFSRPEEYPVEQQVIQQQPMLSRQLSESSTGSANSNDQNTRRMQATSHRVSFDVEKADTDSQQSVEIFTTPIEQQVIQQPMLYRQPGEILIDSDNQDINRMRDTSRKVYHQISGTNSKTNNNQVSDTVSQQSVDIFTTPKQQPNSNGLRNLLRNVFTSKKKRATREEQSETSSSVVRQNVGVRLIPATRGGVFNNRVNSGPKTSSK